MISMAASTPPEDPYAPLRVFADMAKAFADPAKFQERMEKLIAQEMVARAAIEQAKVDTNELEKLRAKTMTELDQARRKHDAQLATERESHLESCRRRTEELDAREKRTAELKVLAETDVAEAARIKADLQRRIRIISGEQSA